MKTIAILAAMQQELSAALKLFDFAKPKKIGLFGMSMHTLEHNGIECILALSGVGRVNTAVNATLIAREFQLAEMINVGSAGGLLANQNILDLVIPSEVIAVDVDLTALGCKYGQVLGDPESYFVDEKIRQKLMDAAKDLTKSYSGAVGSSESFICRKEQVSEIHSRFDNRVVCVEMEAYSIAAVCSRFNIPFGIIRSLSDVPGKGEGNEHDFNAFVNKASDNAAKLLYNYISNLS